ncbi:MAG: endo-1,4-beta-xylanase [Bacteroidaceae bacterium]|nr:endo-1,4-beta-xylanase [Bacteroidaceae bacterium]
MKAFKLIALSLMAFALATNAQAGGEKGLKDAYKKYFKIGVAVNMRNITNPEQIELIKKDYNSITAENDMKPQSLQPQEGQWNWGNADKIADFCRANGIKLRGHTLAWHSQVGQWMFYDENHQLVDKETLYDRMRTHITTVINRYKDIVYCWDVVNEVFTDDARAENPFRQSMWYRIAGEDFIDSAFVFAHRADPNAILYINDYNAATPHKRDKIYNKVKKMIEAGIPVDGIGMQGHYNIYGPSEKDIDDAITKYASIVKYVQFTELDIRVNEQMGGQLQFNRDGAAITPEVKQKFEDQYTMLFRLLRKHKDVIDCVTFWNLSDRDSWLGARNYPLPYDENYKPKDVYYLIRDFNNQKKSVKASSAKVVDFEKYLRGL